MVERRRPSGRPGGRTGGARRPRQSRPASPPPQKLSPVTIILMIVPTLGVLAVVGHLMTREKPAEQEVVEDRPVDQLVAEAAEIQKLGGEAIRAIRTEASDAKKKGQAFVDRLTEWEEKWEKVTKDMRDEDRYFLPEFKGYEETEESLNVLHMDYVKQAPF